MFTWQFGKIGVLVNFITQKLKSKHLVCLRRQFIFEGTRENILHIFQALAVSFFLERSFTGKIVLQPILARKQVYEVGEVCPPYWNRVN